MYNLDQINVCKIVVNLSITIYNQIRTIVNVKPKFEDIKNLLKESTCLWRTWCHIRRGLWINKICDGNWTNLQIIGNMTSNSLDIQIYKWQMTMNMIQASFLNMSFILESIINIKNYFCHFKNMNNKNGNKTKSLVLNK